MLLTSRKNVATPDRSQGTAILNGFGRCLGDSIIGLQALSIACARGVVGPRPTLFRLPDLGPVIDGLYAAAAGFADIEELPWAEASPARPFAGADGFARIIDIRDFAFDPDFRAVAMIDYFLRALGLSPASVRPEERRNTWLRPHLALPQTNGAYILVCPRSNSPLRNMPDEVHAHILAWFKDHGMSTRSQASLPRAESLPELCALVANAALVVSTDTGMVHLADALDVPCLAFFNTHQPVWRVRDYPLCTPVDLAAPDLPDALEFPRDPADVAAARAAWFRPDNRLDWLDPMLERARRLSLGTVRQHAPSP